MLLIPLGIAAFVAGATKEDDGDAGRFGQKAGALDIGPGILVYLPACRVLRASGVKLPCGVIESKPRVLHGFIKTGHEEGAGIAESRHLAVLGRERQGLALVAKKHDALVNDAPKQLVLSFRKLLLTIKGVGVVALVDLILDG